MSKLILSYVISLMLYGIAYSQTINHIQLDEKGSIDYLLVADEKLDLADSCPLFSFVMNGKILSSNDGVLTGNYWSFENGLNVQFISEVNHNGPWGARFLFQNISEDTLEIENFILFGASSSNYYITGEGNHRLSRTRLFRPGASSIPVILPDNAWEMGYRDLPLKDSVLNAIGFSRRIKWEMAQRRRFETDIYPGGSVTFKTWAELYRGHWQEGLRLLFQERYLYDLDTFDNNLFERDDLKWIRDQYVIHLIMAWDIKFKEKGDQAYRFQDFIERGKKWYGGDDVIGLWPTWPALGMDQRNQWDLFRDLPGGLEALKNDIDELHQQGVRFFICYNPWDESTRLEEHLKGMADIISATDADGVVLDTRGSSSVEIQAAADAVRPGVVMYSEGMAVPKDMPGIISGRVHNALYYPPILNLNKFIKPEFSIFRVAELTYEPIRREYNISLFNGHGVEINMFRPGQPDWIETDYKHLGRIARILRENSNNFHEPDYMPLYPGLQDSVYINYWPSADKKIFTLYSLYPEGINDPVLECKIKKNEHIIDLWNHEELSLIGDSLQVTMDAFHKSDLGTNNEGSVSAIAVFQKKLAVRAELPYLHLNTDSGTEIRIWKGNPDYNKSPLILSATQQDVFIPALFPRFEGKLVIQLFENKELIDEQIVRIIPGTPMLLNKSMLSNPKNEPPAGMVFIPGGEYQWITSHGDDFIGYPASDSSIVHHVKPFFMDRYPVTNIQYQSFINATSYEPADEHNFLRHWLDGNIPVGHDHFPVVNVSIKDAQAYAEWAGKRLPSELEWQYAAQEGTLKSWPWGEKLDSSRTNMGDGVAYAVGKHPLGSTSSGLEDLVGQVWQMTADIYDSGSYRYQIVKGGSFYKPLSSWWYVQGGPQALSHRQALLMVGEGFDRQNTVGFRCVTDYKEK